MTDAWIATTVGEWAPFHYGKGLPARDRQAGPFPVYGSNGVVGWHTEAAVTGAGLVVGRKGTVGSVEYCPGPFWPIDTTFFVKDDPKRDLRFTAALLSSLGLEERNSHSAVPGLSRDDAHSLAIRVPPLAEQRRISEILEALDDAIGGAIKLIALADDAVELAGAIALERSTTPQSLALSKLATFTNGYSYASSELVDDSREAMVNLKNFGRTGGFRLDGLKPIMSNARPAQQLAVGDLMVAKTDLTQNAEVIGRCLRMPALTQFDQYVASLDIAIVRAKDLVSSAALHALLAQPDFRDHCLGYTNGTTVLHMGKGALDDYVVVLPDTEQMTWLEMRVRSVTDVQDSAWAKLTTLRSLYEFLLPRLVMGELRVSEAEELVEAAS